MQWRLFPLGLNAHWGVNIHHIAFNIMPQRSLVHWYRSQGTELFQHIEYTHFISWIGSVGLYKHGKHEFFVKHTNNESDIKCPPFCRWSFQINFLKQNGGILTHIPLSFVANGLINSLAPRRCGCNLFKPISREDILSICCDFTGVVSYQTLTSIMNNIRN